jgi:hypothetical protein
MKISPHCWTGGASLQEQGGAHRNQTIFLNYLSIIQSLFPSETHMLFRAHGCERRFRKQLCNFKIFSKFAHADDAVEGIANCQWTERERGSDVSIDAADISQSNTELMAMNA